MLPEIAFIGRSNVGKSSLLNSLTGRKGLARVSGTPGKTQHMLDATVQIPVLRNLTAKIEARNLLNARYLFEQGGVVRQAYFSGRVFGVGFRWEI